MMHPDLTYGIAYDRRAAHVRTEELRRLVAEASIAASSEHESSDHETSRPRPNLKLVPSPRCGEVDGIGDLAPLFPDGPDEGKRIA